MNPAKPAAEMTAIELAAYIDHSVLKPEFTPQEVRREVQAAVALGCRTACVNPASISMAKNMTAGTQTGVCAVVDFPFGASTTTSKATQAQLAMDAGADEIDIVTNYGWARAGLADQVEEDLRAVVETCHARNVIVKAILETDALTEAQIRTTIEACVAASADFIKTSTGFYTGELHHAAPGASDAMMALMLDAAAGRIKVKGSGSIRDRAHFLRLIDAGVDRLGIGYRSTPVVLGLAATGPCTPLQRNPHSTTSADGVL